MNRVPPASPPAPSSRPARVGVVGLGAMGAHHAENVGQGLAPDLVLAAVCDSNRDRLARFPGIAGFTEWRQMLAAGGLDAVVVATPHFSHVEIGVAAIRAGLHVLMEKPLAVHKADGERLLAAPRRPGQLFGLILNQRGDPAFQQVRALLQSGAIGKVQRVHWVMTDWFRTDAYYRSSPWRASWAGEGGGLLINQASHNLDLYQWLFGMPTRVIGLCGFGRHHAIETEDEVTALFEHADGMTGVFTSSTGESPTSNRLEIVGDGGRLLLDRWQLTLERNLTPASRARREALRADEAPEVHREEVRLPEGRGRQHRGVIENFGRAIRGEEVLLAPAEEGLKAVELANAILLSSLDRAAVALPLDGPRYARRLQALIDQSPRTAELARQGIAAPHVDWTSRIGVV